MGDDEKHDSGVIRSRRALERKARAVERQREAERKAQAEDDDALRLRRLDEAAAPRRAAELHDRAAREQARHAEAHDQ